MKKVKYLIISLISIFAFNINVFAASGSLGVSSSSVYVGDSFTVTANINSAAAWNVHVTASGPVSGCLINQADATADALDTNKTFSATCTATGTGTITINLSGDVTSASDGNAVMLSGSRSVTVSTRPSTPTPPPPTPPSGNNNQPKKSQNNNLSKLEVEGHNLTGEGTNYTLTVSNTTQKINIIATPEDGKSSVEGAGEKDLNVGENIFEIIVTAENGNRKTYTIVVTRKDDKYYQEDIDDFINAPANVLLIKDQEELTDDTINKLKNVDKKITIAKVDSNAQVLYSYTLEPKNLENGTVTTISFNSKNKIDELTNYADGVTVVVDEKIPSNTEFKLKVDYEDGTELNLYKVQNGKLEVSGKVKVENGYVVFTLDETEEYFLTRATVSNASVVVPKSKGNSIFLITTIVEGIVILGLIVFIIISSKKKGMKEVEKVSTVSTFAPSPEPVSMSIPTPTPTPTPSPVDSYNSAMNSFATSTNVNNNNGVIPSIQDVDGDDLPKMVEEASSRMPSSNF